MQYEITEQFDEFLDVFNKFTSDIANMTKISDAVKLMTSSLANGGKIMSAGNGGSMSDATHFASELVGKYRGVRPAYAAMALSDQGIITCVGNDFGYSRIFQRQIEAVGREGDVFLALSTSGNSENIIVAAERAKMMGITVVAITGKSGGKLKDFADVLIEIPHSGSADHTQELSIIIIHILVMMIERGLK